MISFSRRGARVLSPAGISSRFCSPQNERNPSFGGRATGELCPIFVRAPGEILFKAQAALNDFPLKAWRAVFVARGNSCRLALDQPTEYAFLGGRATVEFCAASNRTFVGLRVASGVLVLPHQSSQAVSAQVTLLGSSEKEQSPPDTKSKTIIYPTNSADRPPPQSNRAPAVP